MKERIFLLGASDPEMDRIVEILCEQEHKVIYAKKDGVRVHAGNAYDANNIDEIPKEVRLIIVECEIESFTHDKRIDHHRPGDFGFGKGPEEFWEASSLGQMFSLFGLPKPESGSRDLVLAAMDHCYNDAMHDLCPNVKRNEVLRVKTEEIAKAAKKSVDEVEKTTQVFREKIRTSPTVVIGKETVFDLQENTGVGYSLEYLTAQVAAVLEDVPVIIHLYEKMGGQERLHLCGSVKEETLTFFIENWAPKNNLVRIYGNPARGYAGGYK